LIARGHDIPWAELDKEAQQVELNYLLQWAQEYETRDDEYGLKHHRKIFDSFTGLTTEFSILASRNDP
jgi:hypothetical protein